MLYQNLPADRIPESTGKARRLCKHETRKGEAWRQESGQELGAEHFIWDAPLRNAISTLFFLLIEVHPLRQIDTYTTIIHASVGAPDSCLVEPASSFPCLALKFCHTFGRRRECPDVDVVSACC